MGIDRPGRTGGDPSHTRQANGSRPEGLETRVVPFEDIEEPVDLVAVQADDEFLTALSAGATVAPAGRGGYDPDNRLAAMLAAWKAEVESEPIPELVDVDTAVETITRAAAKRRGRRRYLVPLASAAALIVVAAGGVSVGAQHATPGDVLFPITKVLYQEQARSAEAVVTIEEANKRARRLLEVGDVRGATEAIAIAKQAVADVQPEDGREQLVAETEFLEAKADETPQGTPADLSTPPSSQHDPARRPSRPAGEQPGTGPALAPPSSSGEVQGTPGGGSPDPEESTSVAPTPEPHVLKEQPTEPTTDAPAPEGETTPSTEPQPSQGSAPGTASGATPGEGTPQPDTPTS